MRRKLLLRIFLPLVGNNFIYNQPMRLTQGDGNRLGGNTFSLVRLRRCDRRCFGFSAKSEQTLLGARLFPVSAATTGDRLFAQDAAGRVTLV